MRKGIFTFAIVAALLNSCSFSADNYQDEISRMNDTLFKSFPTVNRVSVEIKKDFGTEMIITLGDTTLYNGTDAKRQQVADKIQAVAGYIFSHKGVPSSGKVIFVKEEQGLSVDEATSKKVDLQLKETK